MFDVVPALNNAGAGVGSRTSVRVLLGPLAITTMTVIDQNLSRL